MVEVSLFGPGYGESVVLHIGANNWIIVDSCIDPFSHFPIPLAYLRSINVDPGTAVKLVIATHWHDDHIRGLSTIYKNCESAEFVCSGAVQTDEFLTLAEIYGIRPEIGIPGISEFSEILALVKERSASRIISFKLASSDKLLWQKNLVAGEHTKHSAIHALSPSDASVLLSKCQIAKLIPGEEDHPTRIPALSPNHTSIVLLVQIEEDSILIGSDLEETGDLRGWTAIVDSKTRPQGKASFFKIPHHGSATADHDKIWSLLLKPSPISALTPFAIGNVFLPTQSDVTRIYGKTIDAFSTGTPQRSTTKGRGSLVDKQIKEMGLKIRQVKYSTGQVRARGRYANGEIGWTVELLNGAIPLTKVYQ